MGKSRIVRFGIALVAAIVAGIGAAVLSALALTIAELYLSGHSLPTLSQTWTGSGWLHMSVTDPLFLALTLLSPHGTGVLVYWVVPHPPGMSRRLAHQDQQRDSKNPH